MCACIGTSSARLPRADSLRMGALAGEADVCPFAGGAKTGPPVVVMADVTWFNRRVCDWGSAWQWLVWAQGRVW